MDKDLSTQKSVLLHWKIHPFHWMHHQMSCQNFNGWNFAKKKSHLNTSVKCSLSAEHLFTHLYCYYDIIFPNCVKTSLNNFTKLLVWKCMQISCIYTTMSTQRITLKFMILWLSSSCPLNSLEHCKVCSSEGSALFPDWKIHPLLQICRQIC